MTSGQNIRVYLEGGLVKADSFGGGSQTVYSGPALAAPSSWTMLAIRADPTDGSVASPQVRFLVNTSDPAVRSDRSFTL